MINNVSFILDKILYLRNYSQVEDNALYIDLPLKSHLKKYLIRKLSLTDNEFKLSTNDNIGFGLYLTELLSKKRNYYINGNYKNIDCYLQTLNEKLSVYIKPMYLKKTGIFLNNEKVYYINKFIDKQFRNELSIFIQSNKLFTPDFVIEVGIDNFLSIYKINETDINETTLIRDYFRNKNKFSYVERF